MCWRFWHWFYFLDENTVEYVSKKREPVVYIINETEKNFLDLTKVYSSAEERKNFKYSYPLHDGENKLEVTVYNDSGVSETSRVLVRK